MASIADALLGASVAALGARRVLGKRPGQHARGGRCWLRVSNSKAMQQLLGDNLDPEVILKQDMEEIKAREKRELADLEEELDDRGPTDEDFKVADLEVKQERIRLLMERRRRKKHNGRSAVQSCSVVAPHHSVDGNRPPVPPEPWRLILQTSSGRWYYYNSATGFTSWDPPSTMAERPAEPPRPWQLVLHKPTGKWYYHNMESGKTSWQPPVIAAAPPVRSLADANGMDRLLTHSRHHQLVRSLSPTTWTRSKLRLLRKFELMEMCKEYGLNDVDGRLKADLVEQLLALGEVEQNAMLA